MPEILTDELLIERWPASAFWPEQNWRPGLPVVLIFASCHGRTLYDYFRMRHDFMGAFNIMRLETGLIRQHENKGINMYDRPMMRRVFQLADILLTYNMGPRHGTMALERIRNFIRPDCRIITWTAPNFSAMSPVNGGYCGAIGVLKAMQDGLTEAEIIQQYQQGLFDPLFGIRWAIEIGRLKDRDDTHDVKLADFIIKHHKTHKLFTGYNHPTMTTCACLGSQMIGLLGHAQDTEEKILSYNYMEGALEGEPETDYEFAYYGLKYPQRHRTTRVGGAEYFEQQITDAYRFWEAAGQCTIPPD